MAEFDVVIPVYKPDHRFYEAVKRLCKQKVKPSRVIIMNTFDTVSPYVDEIIERLEKTDVIKESGVLFTGEDVEKSEFDHGATRNAGIAKSYADYVLLMTQDAVPADSRLTERLLAAFGREKTCAVSYARQLPRKNASYFEAKTREYNYSPDSYVRTKDDLQKYGIKTYFLSDVCAMYKRSVFNGLGGFTPKTIFNEDMLFAATLLDCGLSICYVADARVYHSHSYGLKDQFTRSFDNGVSHKQYASVFERAKTEGEGINYVKSMLGKAAKDGEFTKIPGFIAESGARFIGFELGRKFDKLPEKLVEKLSMNKGFWKDYFSD